MDRLYEILEKHFGKIVGMILGLIFAILVVTLGFWKTVFILACIIIGFFIGKVIDNNVDLRDFLDRFLTRR
jgi:uncharacterized membrane protein